MKIYSLKFSQGGFTLIELLVVISIIGLLSSVVVSSVSVARAKSRDTRRMQDLVQMRNALELYAISNSGHYPLNKNTDGTPAGFIGTTPSCNNPGGATVAEGLVTGKFISKIPQDPLLVGSKCYIYYGIPDETDAYGIGYKFIVFQGLETFTTTNHPLRDPCVVPKPDLNKSLAIYTPNAKDIDCPP